MFGFIYYGIVLICKSITAGKNLASDYISESKAKREGRFGYFDHNGVYYHSQTDKPVYHDTLKNGDRVVKTYDGEIIKNFDSPSRNKRIEEKNKQLSQNGNNLKIIGRYMDIYGTPRLKHICGKIPKTASIYCNERGEKFIRVSTSGTCSQKAYMQLSNGEYIMFNPTTEEDKKWLHQKNRALLLGEPNVLVSAKSIETTW